LDKVQPLMTTQFSAMLLRAAPESNAEKFLHRTCAGNKILTRNGI
jgi:hypothetical protein